MKTRTDHIAVFIIHFFGSLKFLIGCILFFIVWIIVNLKLAHPFKPFDHYPFPVLEMIVSLFAIILSISVLINQNRQGRIERIRQEVEFEINVRAEAEITKILNMVHDIHLRMGLGNKPDNELEVMKEQTDINLIHRTVDDKAESESSNDTT